MRLALTPNPTPEDLDRVRQDIDNAMQRLGVNDYLDGQSIEELLEQICDLWEGSCEISYRLDLHASSALADDSAAAYCTLEVIREAVNNAIKHGNAKQIEIVADLNSEVIELTVTNDGNATQLSTPGLGSSLYQELALDYKLSLGSPTQFWAKIPLSPITPGPITPSPVAQLPRA
jgi:signal transduction histidine kinase